jgi:predicted phage terminase large subunit-like protein
VVEPATPFVDGWHLGAICEHLEAVTRGEIRDLIINIPPRCMKSLATCVFWPTWVWIDQPAKRWLFSSYAETLAIRDSLKCRLLILSPWYQERWGDRYRLANENLKHRFSNNKTGYRIALGVGGGATGEGGDFIIVDDPHKAQEADSDVVRQGVLDWWDQTMSTRGNDPKTAARVVIMQRLHDQDLTGHLLAANRGYVHLCLPMRYEPRRYEGPLLWQDPRSEPGELLWKERFGEVEVKRLELELGEAAAGQLQQRPAPAGGAIFREEWWQGQNRYDATDPRLVNLAIARWLFYDTALKDKESNDFSACSIVEMQPDYRLTLRRVWEERLQFPDLMNRMEQDAGKYNRDGKLRGLVIEDKVSGTSAIQTLLQAAPDWLKPLVQAFMPTGSKEERARAASVWCSRGMVLLPEPSEAVPWLMDFEQRLWKFPNIAHKDEIDSFTMSILFLEHFLAEGWAARIRAMVGGNGTV